MTWPIYVLIAVVALFGLALGVGSLISLAIGRAQRNALVGSLDEEEEGLDFSRYSRRRRQKARSRGAIAAEKSMGPSVCPYTSKDEPLRQEWLTGHVLVRMKRLRPPETEVGRPRSEVSVAGPGVITRRAAL